MEWQGCAQCPALRQLHVSTSTNAMHIYAYILATSLRYKYETFFQTADVCLGVFSRNNRQNIWLIYTGLAQRKVLPTVLVGGGADVKTRPEAYSSTFIPSVSVHHFQSIS